jgi:hypothetical protein
MPWHLEPGQPETEIKVVYGSGQGTYDAFAKMFRSTRFLETVAEFSREHCQPAGSELCMGGGNTILEA